MINLLNICNSQGIVAICIIEVSFIGKHGGIKNTIIAFRIDSIFFYMDKKYTYYFAVGSVDDSMDDLWDDEDNKESKKK